MAITQTGAMYKSLSFDNTPSRSYGVYITGEAVYNAPERAVEMISIPGRNGAFALDQGRFENIEVSYPAGIFADNEADFAQAVSDFRNFLCSKKGYCRLTDEYNPSEYRMAVYKSGLEVDPAQLRAGEFTITFDCKPQRWLTSGETATAVASGGTVTNPTLFESSPMLEVTGYGNIEFTQYASMLDNLENLTTQTLKSFRMLSMEEMDQGFGFIHYSTKIEKPLFPLNITLQGISDYAWVDFEGERKAEFSHDAPQTSIDVDVPENGGKLDILVENQGRINFSLVMDKNRKGILGGVVLNKQMFHSNWTMRSLPLSNLEKISWQAIPSNKQQIKYPAFFKAKLSIKNPKDTYLTFGKSGRGYCWINGYQLARYDKTSPLITMHIPAALLKSGENTIEILELENADLSNIKSVQEPVGNVKGEIKVLK